jgi:hypothetical protein
MKHIFTLLTTLLLAPLAALHAAEAVPPIIKPEDVQTKPQTESKPRKKSRK